MHWFRLSSSAANAPEPANNALRVHEADAKRGESNGDFAIQGAYSVCVRLTCTCGASVRPVKDVTGLCRASGNTRKSQRDSICNEALDPVMPAFPFHVINLRGAGAIPSVILASKLDR